MYHSESVIQLSWVPLNIRDFSNHLERILKAVKGWSIHSVRMVPVCYLRPCCQVAHCTPQDDFRICSAGLFGPPGWTLWEGWDPVPPGPKIKTRTIPLPLRKVYKLAFQVGTRWKDPLELSLSFSDTNCSTVKMQHFLFLLSHFYFLVFLSLAFCFCFSCFFQMHKTFD